MTEPLFRVEWSDPALDDWRSLPLDDAARIAGAVARFPHEGIVIATGPTEYVLSIGVDAVLLVLDRDTLHVDRVRRA